MSGSLCAGDRVEVIQEFCGFSKGMIGYVVSPNAQCDGYVIVRFFNDKIKPFEFPSDMLEKKPPEKGEVLINEDIETYNTEIEKKRKGATVCQQQNSNALGNS